MHQRLIQRAILATVVSICPLFSSQAFADSFHLYSPPGNEAIVSPGPDGDSDFLLTSTQSPPGYAGMYLQVTGSLDINQILTLSARYEMTQGTFGAGAPRFTLFDDSVSENPAYVYWGTPAGGGVFTDPNAGSPVLNSTGNLADLSSTAVRIESEGFGGLVTGPGPASFLTWSQFASHVGTTGLSFITLDLDAGFAGTQQMYADDFRVNAEDFDAQGTPAAVPEPASLMLVASGLAFAIRRKMRKLL
jgi:hypothetical protein